MPEAAAQGGERAPRPPNVILLFSDDHGTLDLNVYGSADLYTPHLDRLAARGVRFTQFYAAAAVCSPSRAALMTGRYPVRAGLVGNAPSRPEHFGRPGGLPAGEITIAEMLRAAGYRTAQLGKWHLGTDPGPNGQGFDYSFGFLGGCIDQWSHFNYGGAAWGTGPKWHDLQCNGREVWASGTHAGDLIVREAIRFIEAEDDAPFFLYVAFGLPHYPLQPYDRHRARYAHLPEPRSTYAALVTTLDEQVGRLLDRVDELGLRENTIVIFQSDHGHSTEARANYGGGNAGPYRGAKGSLFEGGLRVPALIAWPGTLPEDAVRDQLAHGTDWLPTLAALTGARLLNEDLDGQNLVPVLRSAEAPTPHEVIHWLAGRGRDAQWAVRAGPWKLIGNPRDTSGKAELAAADTLFLTNLERDPSEMTNHAAEHPEVVARLQRLHERWRQRLAP